MEDIAVQYEPAAEVPWELTADRGRVPPGGTLIILTGEVVARTPTAAEGLDPGALPMRWGA